MASVSLGNTQHASLSATRRVLFQVWRFCAAGHFATQAPAGRTRSAQPLFGLSPPCPLPPVVPGQRAPQDGTRQGGGARWPMPARGLVRPLPPPATRATRRFHAQPCGVHSTFWNGRAPSADPSAFPQPRALPSLQSLDAAQRLRADFPRFPPAMGAVSGFLRAQRTGGEPTEGWWPCPTPARLCGAPEALRRLSVRCATMRGVSALLRVNLLAHGCAARAHDGRALDDASRTRALASTTSADARGKRRDGRAVQRERERQRAWARRVTHDARMWRCPRCGVDRADDSRELQRFCACGAAHPLRCVDCGGRTKVRSHADRHHRFCVQCRGSGV